MAVKLLMVIATQGLAISLVARTATIAEALYVVNLFSDGVAASVAFADHVTAQEIWTEPVDVVREIAAFLTRF